MKIARFALASAAFVLAIFDGPRVAFAQPAPYCDRGKEAAFCPGTNLKNELAKVNAKLREDIQIYKKAEARHFRPYGFDAWQEMYLEGEGLEGRHFSLASGSGSVFPLQDGTVLTDSNKCESPALQIKIKACVRKTEPGSCTVEVVGGPSGATICGQELGASGVQIVKGYWDGNGDWKKSDTEVTLSCNADGNEANKQLPSADGALTRCLRYYRYKAGKNENKDLTACIRMQRADFCGNGRSLTFVGTYIDAHDQDNKIDDPSECTDDGMCFEANWSARGAECVGHTRWTDLDYAKICSDKFPVDKGNGVHCRRGASINQADIFTRSMINTCGTDPKTCGPDTVSPGCQSNSTAPIKKGRKK